MALNESSDSIAFFVCFIACEKQYLVFSYIVEVD